MNVNKVILAGNLTRDPQLSYTPNQTAVISFGLAVNRNWTDKTGQKQNEACFVDCRAFGRTAENINKYLNKGMPLFVEGRLSLDQWQASDGSKRQRLRVIIESFQFLPSGRSQAASQGNQQEQAEQHPDEAPYNEPANDYGIPY